MDFRRLGLVLLILGILLFGATVFSYGSEVPKDATWIFLPQNSPQNRIGSQLFYDYTFTSVTLRLDLANSSGPMLQVEFWLSVLNLTRTYGLGILQPSRVSEGHETASASNNRTSVSTPITNVTSLGTYLTRCWFKFNTYGTQSILLSVPLSDAITFWGLGRRGMGFTFGSGYGTRGGAEVDQFMTEADSSVIFNHGLTLSVTYPSTWQISLSETYPLPDKEFGVGQGASQYKAATWWLNFTAPILRDYYVTVTLAWVIPDDLVYREWIIFGSGVAIAIAPGLVMESIRRDRRQRADPKPRNLEHESGTIVIACLAIAAIIVSTGAYVLLKKNGRRAS